MLSIWPGQKVKSSLLCLSPQSGGDKSRRLLLPGRLVLGQPLSPHQGPPPELSQQTHFRASYCLLGLSCNSLVLYNLVASVHLFLEPNGN